MPSPREVERSWPGERRVTLRLRRGRRRLPLSPITRVRYSARLVLDGPGCWQPLCRVGARTNRGVRSGSTPRDVAYMDYLPCDGGNRSRAHARGFTLASSGSRSMRMSSGLSRGKTSNNLFRRFATYWPSERRLPAPRVVSSSPRWILGDGVDPSTTPAPLPAPADGSFSSPAASSCIAQRTPCPCLGGSAGIRRRFAEFACCSHRTSACDGGLVTGLCERSMTLLP